MARKKAFTKKRQALFLEEIEKHGNASEAARVVGINQTYVHDFAKGRPERRGRPPEPEHLDFKEAWDEALLVFLDAVDREIIKRALEGTQRLKEKRKTDKDGNLIETVKEAATFKSDYLIGLVAKNRHPLYQAVKKHEHEVGGPGGGPIKIRRESALDLSQLNDEELLRFQELAKKAEKTEDDDVP